MNPQPIRSRVDQVVERLREGMLGGVWRGVLPGRERLAAELGVSHSTVEEAMRRLAGDGWLVSEGPGKRRRIVLPRGESGGRVLHVGILLYGKEDIRADYIVDLRHKIEEAGHVVRLAAKTLTELKMDVGRVARLVGRHKADAWIVVAGSREVLEWFVCRPEPVFGLFGRIANLPIAGTGPYRGPAIDAVLDRLVALGHERIVLLVYGERRKPTPGVVEQGFLEGLATRGIPVSLPYHLPDWQDSPAGFRRCIDGLFKFTAPSALIASDALLFFAAQQHLARHGLSAPRDVSMICLDPDPIFAMADPPVAHIRWDSAPIVRRVLRWVGNVSRGKEDRRINLYPAEFIEGGTIGPVATRK